MHTSISLGMSLRMDLRDLSVNLLFLIVTVLCGSTLGCTPCAGTVSEAQPVSSEPWVIAHGALMAAAWALLLPLGTLASTHRYAGRRMHAGVIAFVRMMAAFTR